jgi:hypothetical protein
MDYFDFHLRCAAPADISISSAAPIAPSVPEDGPSGGVVFGRFHGAALPFRTTSWIAGATLENLIGANDPRFPGGPALIYTLNVEAMQFLNVGRRPASDWWPLLETLRERNSFLRLPPAPNGATASAIRRVARLEPRARVLADPFLHGPSSNWPAHIRLAETPNIFLSTLGAFPDSERDENIGKDPSVAGAWDSKLLNTAMHFLSGEVGAGRLLFASGRDIARAARKEHVEKWLTQIEPLDNDQRQLIAIGNARELFGE